MLLLCVAGIAAAAASPATADSVEFEYLEGIEVTLQALQCDPAGTSTATLLVTGTAGGPHPGTFESSITLTAGSQRFGTGELLELNETFRIDSGETVITGTKHLITSEGSFQPFQCTVVPSAECEEVFVLADAFGDALRYDATITSPEGTRSEQGYADFHINADGFTCGGAMQFSWGSMQQFFTSALPSQTPAAVELSPATAVNPVDTFHELTASVSDADGQPVAGAIVRFEVSGSSSARGDCRTDGNGQCFFSYQVAAFPGSDSITAYVDTNANGVQDTDEPSDTAEKTIVLPASTPGQTSGGGQFLTREGSAITFNVIARSDGSSFQGDCTIIDKTSGTTIRCLDVLAYVQHGSSVTIFGNAEQNGVLTWYRISVDDNSRQGSSDLVTITTTAGFVASGPVTSGDVNVR